MNIDIDDINSKINKIFSMIELLENKVENIDKKIKEISDIYIQYEFNRNLNLNQSNSYLRFQVSLLKKLRILLTTIF